MQIKDRLTTKAKTFLQNLPDRKTATVGQILDAINKSSGMGKHLISTASKINIDPTKKISIENLVKGAFYEALKFEHSYVGTEHFLLSLLKICKSADFKRIKIEFDKLNLFPHTFRNLEPSKKTPFLDTFGQNLTSLHARNNDMPFISRPEYKNLISVLLQKENNYALMLGDGGVGKSTMLAMLARNLNNFDVPSALLGYHVYTFDIIGFISHLFSRGSVETGITSLVDELRYLGKVVLYLENYQSLFITSTGGVSVPFVYTLLRSSLAGSQVRIVGSMQPALYEKISVDSTHYFDNFTVVEVDEPEDEVTQQILNANSEFYSTYHNVTISPEVMKYIFTKAKNHLKDIKFPQKGLVLLDQACARLVMKQSSVSEEYKDLIDKTYIYAKGMSKSVDIGDYSEASHIRTKLRQLEKDLLKKEIDFDKRELFKLTTAEVDEALAEMDVEAPIKAKRSIKNLENLSNLADKLKKRVIGQESAIDSVVKSLIRSMLGLRARKRPLGNFLFLGQTGVGKTELAKVLSEEVFGLGSLIRLDMSDFAEKHTVARLVGAPPGYVGYGEGGELTQKIEQRPESVVLFDEIEKAHPDVLNILLQIMEEGELSDAKGNTFDFSKAIIILTSNLGTEILHNKSIGFDEADLSDSNVEGRLKLNLKKIMKPELLNRFDETIVFNRLQKPHLEIILANMLKDFNSIINDQAVFVKLPKKALQVIIKNAETSEYGARALRRAFEKHIIDHVAEVLLKDKSRPLRITFETDGSKISVKNSQ